jgi:peptidoglycan/xylan/chitin deacetylase (PgdA/CDA1 family)
MADAIDLVPLTIGRVALPQLAWAEGERVSVPRALLESAGLVRLVGADGTLDIPSSVQAPHGASTAVRDHAAFTDRPPASARLPVSYQVAPGWARALIASAAGRWQRRSMNAWARFPGFPLDLSADFVADLERGAATVAALTPVMVSHDIDSPEGLRNLVDRFLPIEEAAGARSVNFIVPCAWPVDEGLVREAQARGHEVGVHGFDHANRTPFAAPDERTRRLDAARPFVERYGARGYRAPSLLRTRALLRGLPAIYAYDSSIPTSGGLFPVPNNGCATARPFRIEGIAEVPVTMPRDGSLRFLGYSPAEIVSTWRACASRIAKARGVVMLLTHCERRFSGTPAMLDAYRRFLDFVRESGSFEWRLTSDVAATAVERA